MLVLVLYKSITMVNGEQSVMITGAAMTPKLLAANLVIANMYITTTMDKGWAECDLEASLHFEFAHAGWRDVSYSCKGHTQYAIVECSS